MSIMGPPSLNSVFGSSEGFQITPVMGANGEIQGLNFGPIERSDARRLPPHEYAPAQQQPRALNRQDAFGRGAFPAYR